MAVDGVVTHYSQSDLVRRIKDGLEKSGVSLSTVSVHDLGPVDEFHTGGRVATEHLFNSLQVSASDHILDIGCGIGGTCRFLVDRFNVDVDGIDITPDYIETGKILNNWVSHSNKIDLRCEDAADLSKPDNTYDLAVMLHVGMNIDNKKSVFTEVNRVLKPGGRFAIYDVLQKNDGELSYPVPWASNESMSFVETLEVYQELLTSSDFVIEAINGRSEFANLFFEKMQESMESAGGPPAVGLHILMGPSIKEKIRNFSLAISSGILEPTEIIAIKN